MNLPFYIECWNNVANAFEFMNLHCLLCSRFWNPEQVAEAQPICWMHTRFLTRIQHYWDEGKLWTPGLFTPIPPECGRFVEK